MQVKKVERICGKCESLVGTSHKTACVNYSDKRPFVDERIDRLYIVERLKPVNPVLQAALEQIARDNA